MSRRNVLNHPNGF